VLWKQCGSGGSSRRSADRGCSPQSWQDGILFHRRTAQTPLELLDGRRRRNAGRADDHACGCAGGDAAVVCAGRCSIVDIAWCEHAES
jgi:hypothetical protein